MNVNQRQATGIDAGTEVVIVMHSPREKCWGVLGEINAAGIFFRGIDLNAFDDWIGAITHDEPFIGLTDMFLPMWRIERITRDEAAAGVPSLAEQFEQRTGKSVLDM